MREERLLNWRQAVPTAITLAAMLAGFLSILVTIEGMQSCDSALFRRAAQLIMLAMILDGLDGNVARWLGGTSDFGSELDTYVDMTAFGIAPAILIYAVAIQQQTEMFRVLLPSAVALSGVVRLARFKVKDTLRGQGGYAGLPITANAAWVSLLVFISQTPPPKGSSEDLFSLNQGWFAAVFLLGVLAFIILQVTNLRYPKPTKKTSLFAICVILTILFVALHHRWASRVAAVMIVIGLIYVVIGPLFVKSVTAHRARKEARDHENE